MNSYGPTPVHPGPSQNPGNDINSGGYSGSYYIRYYFQTDAQFNALIVSLFLLALITFLGKSQLNLDKTCAPLAFDGYLHHR